MVDLADADESTVIRRAAEIGSLPVRLAMLGLASIRKGQSPLWYSYPPGVFLGYKWAGEGMRDYVLDLARYVRSLGCQAFLDVENLDADADAYFSVPTFIARLQDCTYYVVLLTEGAADSITARSGSTGWIHDEFQHAVRVANAGRLVIVPLLVDDAGTTDAFTRANVIDLTNAPSDFSELANVLPAEAIALNMAEVQELSRCVGEFDSVFLTQDWEGANEVLLRTAHLAEAFDHQFRRMLHSVYTANQDTLDTVLGSLLPRYGQKFVSHVYAGYCREHGIPNREMPST